MKKSIILLTSSLLLIVSMSIPCKAQEAEPITSQFGIKGGVNFSHLYTKDAESTKGLAGFNVGVFSKMSITDNLAIQPELYYTTKGSMVTYNNVFVSGTATFKLNYIELPLLLVVGVTEKLNIYAGPYAAYLLSGKVINKSDSDVFNFEDNINADDYNRIDAGVTAGADLDFNSVSIGARYTYGMVKVGKEKTYMGTTYTFPDSYNGILTFYASVPLHKN